MKIILLEDVYHEKCIKSINLHVGAVCSVWNRVMKISFQQDDEDFRNSLM